MLICIRVLIGLGGEGGVVAAVPRPKTLGLLSGTLGPSRKDRGIHFSKPPDLPKALNQGRFFKS